MLFLTERYWSKLLTFQKIACLLQLHSGMLLKTRLMNFAQAETPNILKVLGENGQVEQEVRAFRTVGYDRQVAIKLPHHA
jgi:hypothetical protein